MGWSHVVGINFGFETRFASKSSFEGEGVAVSAGSSWPLTCTQKLLTEKFKKITYSDDY